MSAATDIPWMPQESKRELDPVLENAPFAVAQCQREGNITAFNPALERMLGASSTNPFLFLTDLMTPQDRAAAERLLGELFERQRGSFQMESPTAGANS